MTRSKRAGTGLAMPRHMVGIIFVAAVGAAWVMAAHADVTVQQKTSLDVVSVVKMHGATSTSTLADKQRTDVESHCEGLMSMVCGNLQSGDIVRLDKDLTWRLEPSKKRYREEVFASSEELAAMRAKMQANLEKMRSCPVSQKQAPVDRSQCEMSPPKIDMHKTSDVLSLAGHTAQRTAATLTETCTNKQTGDVCDTIVAVDFWLTQDDLPGSADRRAFGMAYAKKLRLDDASGMMRGEAAKFLAPYQAQIKQLTDKSADLKGQPLKISMRVLMGGKQCGAADKAKSDQASGPDAANPLANVAQASKAVSSLVGGLFHKKSADAPTDSGTSASPTDAGTPKTPDPYAQYLQLAAYNIETVAINTDPIAAERFEVPPDWKKDTPNVGKVKDEDFTCPKVQ